MGAARRAAWALRVSAVGSTMATDERRDAMQVTLQRWSPDDLPVLERSNAPEMTTELGGPETDEQVRQRHERYLREWDTGEARMFRIDVDDEPAGGIGWWPGRTRRRSRLRDGMERLPGVAGQGRRRSSACAR